jgi:Ribbon-helix-helix protein, copG family
MLLQMTQHVQERPNPARVPLGAFVDAEQRRALAELARRQDRSVSSIVRLAVADYLNRPKENY